MLVGGLAAAIQGRLRLTRDLDLLVSCGDESIPTLVEAMRREGFAHHPGPTGTAWRRFCCCGSGCR